MKSDPLPFLSKAKPRLGPHINSDSIHERHVLILKHARRSGAGWGPRRRDGFRSFTSGVNHTSHPPIMAVSEPTHLKRPRGCRPPTVFFSFV
ncbi:hypothetical protein B296_00027691 [Ensete ventricosum]|uniref:Uncharacterized protein n=1 Tax=Ensete ventricosum TaxID=4639 RepID=A0A426YG28_ENSVE|nr:hypothetical protein B296_00027691 [Ensete ventricosum]